MGSIFTSRIIPFCLLLSVLLVCCKTDNETEISLPLKDSIALFTLSDFYLENETLEKSVDSIYAMMTAEERVSQLIISSMGAGTNTFEGLREQVDARVIGGAVFLGKNSKLSTKTNQLQQISRWPLLFSLDAEPSLINSRVTDISQVFSKTAKTKDQNEATSVSMEIADILMSLGIHQNYAPVSDVSSNVSVIHNRSYGNDPLNVIEKTNAFIEEHQASGIVSTVKHFPGHGWAKGDSHLKLVSIKDVNQELDIFKENIANGVLSVMVGHIAIESGPYHTDGKPSSISKSVITDLLRDELDFKGIIITDAMNMKGVTQFEDVDLEALKAGVDLVLMPQNPEELIQSVKKEIASSEDLHAQIENSIRRVIKLKLCLGLFKEEHVDYRRIEI